MNNGKQNDTELQYAACSRSITATSIQNLQDLLNAIDGAPPSLSGQTAMLHTAARRLSEFLEKPLEKILIDDLIPVGPRFKIYLKDRRYDPHTIRAYAYHVRKLVEIARHFGWEPHRPDVTNEWEKIRQSVWRPNHNAAQIVEYAISIGKPPGLFTDKELKEWCDLTAAQGRRVRYARDLAASFRNRIFRAGLETLLPKGSPPRHLRYGEPLSKLPQGSRVKIPD